MKIKKHLLRKNAQGVLVDADSDDDDEENPETQFCRFFNKNYLEISDYFPEFLRLREL
jgi:hypothetical protein